MPRHTSVLLVLVSLIGATLAGRMVGAAEAATPTAVKRILPPGLERQIEATFARAAPAFRLADAKISADAVHARVCAPSGTCTAITLGPPRPACTGEKLGPWCVTGLQHMTGDANPLRRALRADPADAFWRSVAAVPAGAERQANQRHPGNNGSPHGDPTGDRQGGHDPRQAPPSAASMWLALLLHGLLGTLGWAMGFFVRRRLVEPTRFVTLALWAALPSTVLLISDLAFAWLDLWDMVVWAMVITLSALVALTSTRPMIAALVVLGVTLGLGSSELAARSLLPPPVAAPPLGQSPFHRPEPYKPNAASRTWEWEDYACQLLLNDNPKSAEVRHAAAQRFRPGRRKVLHIGDSMVHGMSVPPAQTTVGRLDQLDPKTGHASVGMPGTTVDAALLAFRRWQPALHPDRVVYYVFPGNDLDELDRPLTCCPDAPLLDRRQASLPTLCSAAPLAQSPTLARMLWHLSPAPYALRALSRYSSLAGWFRVWFGRQLRQSPLPADRRWPTYAATLTRFIAEARAAHVPIILVIMPDRDALTAPAQFQRSLQFVQDVRRLAAAQQVPVHDAGEHFGTIEAASRKSLFLNQIEGDIHLSPAGHAKLSRWLAPRLRTP